MSASTSAGGGIGGGCGGIGGGGGPGGPGFGGFPGTGTPFRAPAHKHAHHLHSIPPREKSTRTLIIDVVAVTERAISLEQLLAADEVFVASTTREVHPVAAVDEHEYPVSAPVTERTAAVVAEAVRARLR